MNFKRNPKTKFTNLSKMKKKEIHEEAKALREGIEYHNYLYYTKNEPVISDRTYDKLLKRLQDIENKYPSMKEKSSPTQKIGAEPVSHLKKRKHASRMLSLKAVLKKNEVNSYFDFVEKKLNSKKIDWYLEPKYDGFSVEIVYKNGVFEYGVTRGDGTKGEDISLNLKTVGSIPMRLLKKEDVPSFLSVRGEVYLSRKGFQKLNKKRIENGENPFANPRNAAAGIMRQKDSKEVAGKPLAIVFYEILQVKGKKVDTHNDMISLFKKWGLPVNSNNKHVSSINKIVGYHARMEKKRDTLDYEIDGIVIKVNNYNERKKLGGRQKSPRWAIAWKFQPKQKVTTVRDIVVQVGRTGMLTPVALLEPVEVGGVTVSRATLHNESEVNKKKIMPNDIVKVERAGDVIPEIVGLKKRKHKKKNKFKMPKKCPSCKSNVYKDGAYYFCAGSLSCRAQLIGKIMHYASREAMNIDGLGDKTIEELVNRKMVTSISDLYALKEKDIKELEGFADKSARKLYNSIQEAKEARLDKFIYALGIRHVGEHIARILALTFKNVKKLSKANKSTLKDISEVGPEIAESVYSFFKEKNNTQTIDRLLKSGVKVKEMKAKKKKSKIQNKTFVFTGELEHITRYEAKQLVELNGGRASSSVSDKTDYVVVGANPGSKLDEAKKRDVKTIREDKFEKLIHA